MQTNPSSTTNTTSPSIEKPPRFQLYDSGSSFESDNINNNNNNKKNKNKKNSRPRSDSNELEEYTDADDIFDSPEITVGLRENLSSYTMEQDSLLESSNAVGEDDLPIGHRPKVL